MTAAPQSSTGQHLSKAGWHDAERIAALFAIAPFEFGGVVVRAGPGPVRDAWCARLLDLLPDGTPAPRLPVHAGPERLLGDLDIGATLALGRTVAQPGLLSAADGGILFVPSAEQLEMFACNALSTALDTGRLRVETDGYSDLVSARFGVIAFDEGYGEDEQIAAALSDRIALNADLTMISYRHIEGLGYDRALIAEARTLLPHVRLPEPLLRAVCKAAVELGIRSGRAELFTSQCARVLAALDGRTTVTSDDITTAAKLVLTERAQVSAGPSDNHDAPAPDNDASPPAPTNDAPDSPGDNETDEISARSVAEIADMIIASVRHEGLGPDVLSRLNVGRQSGSARAINGRQASRRMGQRRGKPSGVERFQGAKGGRINILASLRQAAPWQKIRHDVRARHQLQRPSQALIIERDDLRVSRYRERQGTTILFLVDASGSTALGRLAEAKGAVEMLLFESYRRRDQVALVSFRGDRAQTLLSPTKSLVRAKRELAALPGGGATPLASGLMRATEVCRTIERDGRRPVLVLITDGRPNIDAAGRADRVAAREDALAAARHMAGYGWSALVFDASARPNDAAAELSKALSATYQHLPYMTSKSVAAAVRANLPEAAKSR